MPDPKDRNTSRPDPVRDQEPKDDQTAEHDPKDDIPPGDPPGDLDDGPLLAQTAILSSED